MSNEENGLRAVADFRRRLARAAKDLPRSERDQLLEQINAHFDDAISPLSSTEEVHAVLEALGSPEAIAAAARTASGSSSSRTWLHRLRLTWVLVGILVAVPTLFTPLGVWGTYLQLAFLAVAVVATAKASPREAAPLYLIATCGLSSGVLLPLLLVQRFGVPSQLSNSAVGLALQWQSGVLISPFLIGLIIGVLWLRRVAGARLEPLPT